MLNRFNPPANWDNFNDNEAELRNAFRDLWHNRVKCWFEVARVGNAFRVENDGPRELFYNPTRDFLNEPKVHPDPVRWTAFPKRMLHFGEANFLRWRLADEGVAGDFPQGPRG